MIEPDLAKLIDDHDRAGERFILQQAVEERGLAGAQEAGEHGEGYRLGGLSQGVAGAHFFCGSVLGSALGAGFAAAGLGAACAAVVCAVVADAAVDGAAVVRTILGRGRGNGTEEPSSDREASSGPPTAVAAIAPFALLALGSAALASFLAGPRCTGTGSPRRASCC